MGCIFCGGTPLTNEHVFPQWLNRYLPKGEEQRLEQSRYGERGYETMRSSVGLDFKIRKVCARCNNGWLSRLEADSRDVLHPLILGESDWVGPADQRRIVVWAVKTAMMADNTQVAPLLKRDALVRMRSQRAVPSNTRVWIGACDEMFPLVTAHTVRIDYRTVDGGHEVEALGLYVPMKIGRLCVYVYFPGMEIIPTLPRGYYLALARIWPRRATTFPWPPPAQPATGAEFEAFADNIHEMMSLYTLSQFREHALREP